MIDLIIGIGNNLLEIASAVVMTGFIVMVIITVFYKERFENYVKREVIGNGEKDNN